MRNTITHLCGLLLLASCLLPELAQAQQDPMFTKYMFNSLAFNPAYAGSKEYATATAIVRDQWLTWGKGNDGGGAPLTVAVGMHTPFKNRVGLGAYLSQDRIGASFNSSLDLSYAYRLPLTDQMTLSLGLQAGVTHHAFDFSGLRYRDDPSFDPSFSAMQGSEWMPNAGAGAYFYTDKFYMGASVPRLFQSQLGGFEGDGEEDPQMLRASTYRHMYVTTGTAIPLGSKDLVFKPSLLVKGVGWLGDFNSESRGGAVVRTPTEFDIDLSLLFNEVLWVGASFRSTFDHVFAGKSSHDSADLWAACYLKNGMRIGVAYDYSLTELQQYGSGSAEIMLGYDLNFNMRKIATPRYF